MAWAWRRTAQRNKKGRGLNSAAFLFCLLRILFAAKRPLPPTLFRRLSRIIAGRGVGNIVLQRPHRRGGRAWGVPAFAGGGVDLIGHGTEAVHHGGKARLGRFGRSALAVAAATAATAAAALAARLSILTPRCAGQVGLELAVFGGGGFQTRGGCGGGNAGVGAGGTRAVAVAVAAAATAAAALAAGVTLAAAAVITFTALARRRRGAFLAVLLIGVFPAAVHEFLFLVDLFHIVR